MTHEPQVISDRSRSPLDEATADPAFRLAWENDVRFHVSRHLLRLRTFRRMSQVLLANKVGTSQSAIARIESGEENATETTVERIINALDGRLRVSIAPAEYPAGALNIWWKTAPVGVRSWTIHKMEVCETANDQRVRMTLGREFQRDTLPSVANMVLEAEVS